MGEMWSQNGRKPASGPERNEMSPTSITRVARGGGAGALVISLDFELLWGLVDLLPPDGGSYRASLLGARTVIPKLLELFAEYEIAATWATVGMLFAESREELETYLPSRTPTYRDSRLSAYGYTMGSNEKDDPLLYAASLIDRIQSYPLQEIGTHTFSHYYCLEPGQTEEEFEADIEAARAIAASRNVRIRSIVFPRNQHNPAYDEVLLKAGVTAYRGNRSFWPDQGVETSQYFAPARRVGRFVDSLLPLDRRNSVGWEDVMTGNGLGNVLANRFMLARHPKLEPLRLRRVQNELRSAAKAGRIYHIWWHPHNMGTDQERHLQALRTVFETFRECQERYGMQSMSMADVRLACRATVQPLSVRQRSALHPTTVLEGGVP